MKYLKQITKVIDISIKNYNEINVDSKDVNVYLNGILQQKNKSFKIKSNKIIFDKDILKDKDVVNVECITNDVTDQPISDKITKKEFCCIDDNMFKINANIDDIINVYINGVLQNKNYEFIIENNKIKFIKINSLVKEDLINIEIIKKGG